MKIIVLPFLSLLLITSAVSIQDMIAAFKKGDPEALGEFFDDTVEITLSGNTGSFTKNKAERIVKDFFKEISVKGFDVIHKSESSGSQYFIGNLLSQNGTYRTTIYIRTKGGKQVIQEIRFEK